ncbi:MAG: protoporphyrinogen oxidase [Pirellulales bacterium]|nr:protoporphyrinogen oxidase [Pirellulales bacterium]
MRKVVVLGGGITGLAAAHRVHELAPHVEVVLVEAAARVGGVLETKYEHGYLLEASADNFITNVPWAIDLCRRVGLGDELLQTNDAQRRAFVVHRGRLQPVPEGFALLAPARLGPMFTTPILSPAGKLRLAMERFVSPRRDLADESLASFARRRLGREVFERLVQPLVGGIYTADPERLSVQAALPRFVEMEHKYGSLIRGTLAERRARGAAGEHESGARYGLFAAPRGGMESLVQAIVARLPAASVRLRTRVESIARQADGAWRVDVLDLATSQPAPIIADAVVVALPAPAASRLLAAVDAPLSADLRTIEYAGCAIVLAGYRREQFDQPPSGFGFVVPEIERRQIIACSYSSQKFPGRAPEGEILLRVFLGGACHPEIEQLDDAELQRIATRELRELLGLRGAPAFSLVRRWSGAMPQYHLGHVERVARILERASTHPGLALAGNAYHGVGVPNCIRSGEQAASRMLGSA